MTLAPAPPSVAVYDDAPKNTYQVEMSASSRYTVAVDGLPLSTPEGSVPKVSSTLSLPSSTASFVAVTMNVCCVSPGANVTLGGTPE